MKVVDVTPASIVVYTGDPLLYGKLIVLGRIGDGRLLCEAVHPDRDGEYARELFDSGELENADTWQPNLAVDTAAPMQPGEGS
jgi:hypothetical protein